MGILVVAGKDASSGSGGCVQCYDWAKGKVLKSWNFDVAVTCMVLDSRGKTLAVGLGSKVELHDLLSGALLAAVPLRPQPGGVSEMVTSMAFVGSMLALGGSLGRTYVIDPRSQRIKFKADDHVGKILAVLSCPFPVHSVSDALVSVDDLGFVRVWTWSTPSLSSSSTSTSNTRSPPSPVFEWSLGKGITSAALDLPSRSLVVSFDHGTLSLLPLTAPSPTPVSLPISSVSSTSSLTSSPTTGAFPIATPVSTLPDPDPDRVVPSIVVGSPSGDIQSMVLVTDAIPPH